MAQDIQWISIARWASNTNTWYWKTTEPQKKGNILFVREVTYNLSQNLKRKRNSWFIRFFFLLLFLYKLWNRTFGLSENSEITFRFVSQLTIPTFDLFNGHDTTFGLSENHKTTFPMSTTVFFICRKKSYNRTFGLSENHKTELLVSPENHRSQKTGSQNSICFYFCPARARPWPAWQHRNRKRIF